MPLLLPHRVVIRRRSIAGRDEYGNEVPTWSETTEDVYMSAEEAAADAETSVDSLRWRLLACADLQVHAGDEVTWESRTFTVLREPLRPLDAMTGQPTHTEAALEVAT